MWKLRMCVCQKLRKRERAREWEWDKNAVYYWHSLCCVMFFVRRSDAEVFIQGWMNSLRNVAAPNIVNVILNENIWQRNSKIELQIVGISGGTECMLYVLCVHSSEEQKLSYIMFLMLLLATAFFFCSPTFSQYISLSLFLSSTSSKQFQMRLPQWTNNKKKKKNNGKCKRTSRLTV